MTDSTAPLTTAPDQTTATAPDVDVVVVGGGAAGLSAGVVLARSRRSVLVIDAGEPRNAAADGVHNYLGQEGVPPRELVARGREELNRYGGGVHDGRAVGARTTGTAPTRFEVDLEDGGVVSARRIVLASGGRDVLPDVPGLVDQWGRGVVHCPFCHGWEVRDQRVAVLATTPLALHQAGLFRQLTDRLTVLTQGIELPHVERVALELRGVTFLDSALVEVLQESGRLTGARLEDGTVLELDALAVSSVLETHDPVADALGVATAALERSDVHLATSIEADPFGATSVAGVFAAGNASDPMATVIAAAAAGTRVGAMVNGDLVAEDNSLAIAAMRASFQEPESWEERYTTGDRHWSGHVNPQLAHDAGPLVPGRALEVGCGEGADAIWLAERGWHVTGIDFSPAGLRRAAQHAEGAGVADRTEWRVGDVRDWEPGEERWDLVTAHYVHLPPLAMIDAVRRLAEAVAPGGTLLVVGHHPDDVGPVFGGDDLFLGEDLVPALGEGWRVETDVVSRTGTGHGHDVVVRDAVLRAVRT